VFDLIDGKIFYPLRITETGEDLKDTGGYVATSSTSQGQLSGSACSDYTSTASTVLTGDPAGTTGRWTSDVSTSCGTAMRIYCFGTDFQAPVTVTPQSGRKIFTLPTWTPNAGGVADADATCQSAASAAGLAGTFLALLATSTASAPSRLSATGENWVRPDGVPLAASASDFLSGDLLTAPNQRANGTYAQAYVWTGASTWGNVGTTNCTNWTIGDSTVGGYRAEAEISAPFMKNTTTTTCSSTARGLLCAEQ
jgi:hypothetical protein